MITEALVLSAILFALGTFGVLVRRNAIIIFLCIELQLNAVNLAFVAFSRLHGIEGQTPVVLSPNDPCLPDVRRAVEKQYPVAIWVVWDDRVDLDPVTLEAVGGKNGVAGGRT